MYFGGLFLFLLITVFRICSHPALRAPLGRKGIPLCFLRYYNSPPSEGWLKAGVEKLSLRRQEVGPTPQKNVLHLSYRTFSKTNQNQYMKKLYFLFVSGCSLILIQMYSHKIFLY